jgi:hypothetical protein
MSLLKLKITELQTTKVYQSFYEYRGHFKNFCSLYSLKTAIIPFYETKVPQIMRHFFYP